jgi:hypothetical protein
MGHHTVGHRYPRIARVRTKAAKAAKVATAAKVAHQREREREELERRGARAIRGSGMRRAPLLVTLDSKVRLRVRLKMQQ